MPTIPSTLTLHGTPTSPGGRHIRAAQSFKPGDAIAYFAEPCIAIPDAPTQAVVCNSCLLSSSSAPRLCTGCKTIAYCSVACQKADWARVHKEECKVFRRVQVAAQGQPLPTPVRALVQMLLLTDKMESSTGLRLESHVEEFRRHAAEGEEPLEGPSWRDLELQAMGAVHYLGREANLHNIANALEAACKLQVNTFSRLDPDAGQTGLYMHPGLAMVNHSCTPSAFVQFIGRRAVLRAYRSIQEDEEVTLSYIACESHRSHRQRTLKERYHFQCNCPRCKDDLDVYEVGQAYPHLDLNRLTLIPDLDLYRNPSQSGYLRSNLALQRVVDETFLECSQPLTDTDFAERAKQLGHRWEKCAPLRKAKLYAIEPLPRVLSEASIYFTELGRFSHSLAISCFLALNCDPFQHPMPFHPFRVKGMMAVGKLISNAGQGYDTGAAGQSSTAGQPLEAKLKQVFEATDSITVAQAALMMGAWWGPKAHSEEWQPYQEAVEVLKDVETLPGRGDQKKMLSLWAKGGQDVEAQLFFEHAVLKPVQELASLALDIMDTEFGGQQSLVRRN
ncbi:SET and MYND [Apiospora sp. TS-2023a]